VCLVVELQRTKGDLATTAQSLEKFKNFQYQPNKWTPKEVVQHIIDNERIQSYRALAISRNAQTVLPGYNEERYTENSNANKRSIAELLEEFAKVRASTISLFNSINERQMHNEELCFKVNITPIALGFQIVGHANYHLAVLSERYLN
jgi:hypothetical protein